MLASAPDDEVVAEEELDKVREVLDEDGDVVTGGAGVVDELVDDWVLVEEVSETEAVADVARLVVVEEGEVVEDVVDTTGSDDVEELELCATDEENDDEEGLCDAEDEDEDDVEAEEEEDKVSLVLVVVATVLLGVGSVVKLTVEDEEEEVPIPEKFARVEVAVEGLREPGNTRKKADFELTLFFPRARMRGAS